MTTPSTLEPQKAHSKGKEKAFSKTSNSELNKEANPQSSLVMRIEEQISQLKKRKEKLQSQQALSFVKETQKIFKEDFSSDLALNILSKTWGRASKTEKEEWKKRAETFLNSPFRSNEKKDQTVEPTDHQSWERKR